MSESKTPISKVKMTVRGLVIDPVSKMPVVILQNSSGNSLLPIWIGACEANAIALQLEGVSTPRPMTHDLVLSLIEQFGGAVDHIYIHTLTETVFIASIHLEVPHENALEVDSRPSDAIAIALRAEAEIFVDSSVLERAEVEEASQEEALRAILEKLRPEDMGKYEM